MGNRHPWTENDVKVLFDLLTMPNRAWTAPELVAQYNVGRDRPRTAAAILAKINAAAAFGYTKVEETLLDSFRAEVRKETKARAVVRAQKQLVQAQTQAVQEEKRDAPRTRLERKIEDMFREGAPVRAVDDYEPVVFYDDEPPRKPVVQFDKLIEELKHQVKMSKLSWEAAFTLLASAVRSS